MGGLFLIVLFWLYWCILTITCINWLLLPGSWK